MIISKLPWSLATSLHNQTMYSAFFLLRDLEWQKLHTPLKATSKRMSCVCLWISSISPSLWTSSHHARLLWCSSGPWSFWGPPPHSPHVYGCPAPAPRPLWPARHHRRRRFHLLPCSVSAYSKICIKYYTNLLIDSLQKRCDIQILNYNITHTEKALQDLVKY